jgi:hypothetical protein
MPDYLLPCTCGKKTAVSTAQAGETIHCVCGAALQVPTMRALGQLESADAAAGGSPKRRTIWEDRHRAAFLLVLASIGCLGVAAYLWFTLPESASAANVVSQQGIAAAFDKATPAETLAYYEDMKRGLVDPAIDANEKPRQMMLWGIGLAVLLAAAAGAGAMLVVLRRTRRRG